MPDVSILANLANTATVSGVGDTDYALDYQRARDKLVDKDAYGYAALAFTGALADSGIARSELDGLIAGPTLAGERLGEVLGLDVRWPAQFDAVNAVMQAATAIHAGLVECIALVHGNNHNQRAKGTQYGGAQADGGERYLAYVYCAPWGVTSQGAPSRDASCACKHVWYPPGPVCPSCLATDWHFDAMRPRPCRRVGHVSPAVPQRTAGPYTVISVELQEDPILIGNLAKSAPQSLRLDLPVQVEFETVAANEGEWLIYQWMLD